MTMNQIKAQTLAKQAKLSQARLQQLLDYDPDTGIFTWKVAAGRSVKAGDPAGYVSKSHGYIAIQVESKLYYANRLAWLHFYGIWPTNQIHHMNTVKTDNRIANLDDVTNQVNNSYKRIHMQGHLVGTTFDKHSGKWMARIGINGKREYLGLYGTKEEAHSRCQAELTLHNLN